MKTFDIVASHNISLSPKGEIKSEGRHLDLEAYSRMKYGDRSATHDFAQILSSDIADRLPSIIEAETPPVFYVPYMYVPPACYYLSRYCLDRLNIARNKAGNEPGRLIHLFKDRVATTNYAQATPEQREKELDSIGFSLEGRNIEGTTAIVLDDVRITGSAERKVLEILEPENPRVILLGYVALFNEKQALLDSSVEDRMNSTYIKHIFDVLPSILNQDFDLNIRTLKMIFNSSQEEFDEFLQQCPEKMRYDLLSGAINTGLAFVRTHKHKIEQLVG